MTRVEFVDSITAGRAGSSTNHVRPAQPVPMTRPAGPSAGADPRAVDPRNVDPRTSARRYEGGQLVWRVQCGDLIDRERCVTVLVEQNQVLLVGPPGETARLNAGQLGQLRAALNEAAKLAER